MRITIPARKLKLWCLSSMAAATIWSSHGLAQTLAEPDGMPVYRQRKSPFLQNPFSTTYQRLWNRANAQTSPSGDDGLVEQPETASPIPMPHAPVKKESVTRKSSAGGHGLLQRFVDGRGSARVETSPVRQTVPGAATPTRPNSPSLSPRVLTVNDVNEGTPRVGSIAEVSTPHPSILQSLGEGEKVVQATERVIGIYRDGKLVSVIDQPQDKNQLTPARMDKDPWFGDAVTAPSEEIQAIEALPPQSSSQRSRSSLPIRNRSGVPASMDGGVYLIYLPEPGEQAAILPVRYVAPSVEPKFSGTCIPAASTAMYPLPYPDSGFWRSPVE